MSMRIAIHDFGAHPFTLQLAGALADIGYTVGWFFTSANDAPNVGKMKSSSAVEITDIPFPKFQKRSLVKRKFQEMHYGRAAVRVLAEWKPDLLLSNTCPVDSQITISKWAKRKKIRHLFWFQDIVSHAAQEILTKKLGTVGKLIAANLAHTEKRIARSADFIINISEQFQNQCIHWGIPLSKQLLQPNWPVIDQLPLRPKQNRWAEDHALSDSFVFMYTGTLGFKQRPELLIKLAQSFRHTPQVRIVVVSSSIGTAYLKQEIEKELIPNILLLPFQPFEDLPDVLGTADVLLTIQTAEAGRYCVPSKVLSYLCSGRPQLLAIDKNNQAAQMVVQAQAGIVVDPSDDDEFIRTAHRLFESPVKTGAREFAERNFSIDTIADTIVQKGILPLF